MEIYGIQVQTIEEIESMILSDEYVIEHGRLSSELFLGDDDYTIVVPEKENPDDTRFNGIEYALDSEGNVSYYSQYKNGLKHGQCVRRYHNGILKSFAMVQFGLTQGIHYEWNEDGRIINIKECERGVPLRFCRWDDDGNVVNKRTKATEYELKQVKNMERLMDIDGYEVE